MSAITKLFNPQFYMNSWAGIVKSAQAKYGPMLRDNRSVFFRHDHLFTKEAVVEYWDF